MKFVISTKYANSFLLTVYKIVGSKYKISPDPHCIFFPRYLFSHTMTKALLKNIVS